MLVAEALAESAKEEAVAGEGTAVDEGVEEEAGAEQVTSCKLQSQSHPQKRPLETLRNR